LIKILIDDKYINPSLDMLAELVLKNRSYRRFNGKIKVPAKTVEKLIGLARLCPSGRNQQALKFMPITKPDDCDQLFPFLAWAGYLKEWDGPVKNEQPTAYIIILGDTLLGAKFEIDLGICAQTILLGAIENNFGGCMIGSIRREEVRSLFQIPGHLEILLVIALGKPVERVVVEEVKDGNIRYWRDLEQTHHVPKRAMDEILIFPKVS
jgi:nitroreductase